MSKQKKEILSGILYTGISKYSGIILTLIISGILARLLHPEDFGIVAIATVIITFFSIFSDLGISPAIVQNKSLTEDDLASLFSFTVWLGLFLSFLFLLAAPFIAAYYNSPVLSVLCGLLTVNLFFNTVNLVPNALLYKNKEFKYIAIRSFSIQLATGLLAIIAALSGAGLYALLISPILSSIFIFILSYRKYPQKFRFVSEINSVRKIFSYSLFQFLFNLINYFSRNLDKLLIGKFLGMNPLGYYEKSYRLMMLPIQNITFVITPVLHPVLSDFQNDLRFLASSYERIIRILAFIGFPLSVFLFFTAQELTLLIFGNQWLPSVPVFQILALSAGFQIVLSSSGSIFQAANDTKSLFICGLFSSVLNVSGIAMGVFYFKSLEAIAWCLCITFFINFIQCYLQMYLKTFNKRSLKSLIKQFLSPLSLTFCCILLLWPLNTVISDKNLLANLLIKGISSIFLVSFYLQLSGEYNLLEKIKKVIWTTKKKD
ncbi:lipopolysaccharide biosynthesis protein [Massilibacteroides sp.]|uniref:lipopolysaccharide biosynthesis protein n=1 Tax=Massilibacteroides sp. TaxID=2034766 RepID=UPI002605617A|nr:lipopolysaccharide biosynthesis protein [Massilibacteroides sp.]MDD4514747.1 lipopolysaccharide biosynthesis protein [Massilibacteroides sp.]